MTLDALSGPPGPRVWPADEPLEPALAAARGAGWTTVVLELDGVRSKTALMDRCERAFGLPGWFGRNWDALADCLTDLSWAGPAGGAGWLVAVTGWGGFARARARDAGVLREVLEGAVEFWAESDAGPGFRVLLVEGRG
ncbi:barstar family protein [Streptomyces sp. NPDC101132]|uniref:barstar family protein n=1 Tax=Streptomyces sp. NPDC101132 TaxID=3366110 RepID=UPI00382BD834